MYISDCKSDFSNTIQMQIFLPGGHSSSNMSFLLVNIQHTPDFLCHGRIDLLETFGTVFMYRTLTDSKFFSCLTNGCFCFYDIICNFYCTLFDIIFQKKTPPKSLFLQCMRGSFVVCNFLFFISTVQLIVQLIHQLNPCSFN